MGLKLRDNPGKQFQGLADSSALRSCFVLPLPQIGAKRIPGGKLVPERMPFDRIVVHRAPGRAITYDCKSCALEHSFPVGNETHVPDHQRSALIRAGSEGVLAGLLVEARHPAQGKTVYWIPWRVLVSPPPSLPWGSPKMLQLNTIHAPIDFDLLVRMGGKV